MKNFKKIAFFSTILILICFSFLSLIGFKTHWGATTYNHFKGLNTINWGNDLDDEAKIEVSYKNPLNEEQKEDVEMVLAKRLSLSGIGQNEILFDENKKTITICFPCSYNKYFFDYEDIASYLTSKGDIKIFKSEKNPLDFMAMFGGKSNGKEELLMGEDSIYSATLKYIKPNRMQGELKRGESEPAIILSVDEEKKEQLLDLYTETAQKRKELHEIEKEIKMVNKEIKNIQKENEESEKEEEKKDVEKEEGEEKNEEEKKEDEKKNEENDREKEEMKKLKELEDQKKEITDYIQKQNIKITLDSKPIYEGNILGFIDENKKICAINPKLTTPQLMSTINIINTEQLPVNLTIKSVEKYSPGFGSNAKFNIIVFVLILFAILILFISLKFRMFGLLALLTSIAQISLIVAGYTGFLSFMPGVCVNICAVLGAIISILTGFSSFYYISKKISERLKNNLNLEFSIKQTYKSDVGQIVKVHILIIILSAILMGAFSSTPGVFSTIFAPLKMLLEPTAQNSIFTFSYSLFLGHIGTLIFQILSTKLILQSSIIFKFFRNTRLYGGIKNETKN